MQTQKKWKVNEPLRDELESRVNWEKSIQNAYKDRLEWYLIW